MAPRDPLQRTPERFGSYNNVRSNPYSNSERILDVRNGILDPYTQIAQSTLQTSYNVDSLSAFGNTFRARILGVTEGKPARHLYPDLYANLTRAPEEMPSYFIFALRDESDQFAPDPSDYAASVAGYVNMIGLQGYAISEKPAAEIIESFGRGDIVEVYKPEQNSWNGALVKKVVVRNNFSEYVVSGRGAAAAFNNAGGAGPFGGMPPTAPGVTSSEVANIFRNSREVKFGVWLDRSRNEVMSNLNEFVTLWKNNNITMVNHMITHQTVSNSGPNLGSSDIGVLQDSRWPVNFDEGDYGFGPADIATVATALHAAGIEYTITVWPYPSEFLITDYATNIAAFIEAASPEKIKAIEFDLEGGNWGYGSYYDEDQSFDILDPPTGFTDRKAASKFLLTRMNEIPAIANGAVELYASTHSGRLSMVREFHEAAAEISADTGLTSAGIQQWNVQAYSRFDPGDQATRYPGVLQERAAARYNSQFDSSSPLNPKFAMGLAGYSLSGFDNGALSPYENVLRSVLSTIENSSADRIYFWSVGKLQTRSNGDAVYGVTNAYRQTREGDGTFAPVGIDGPAASSPTSSRTLRSTTSGGSSAVYTSATPEVTNGRLRDPYNRLIYDNADASRDLPLQNQLLAILQSVAYQERVFIEIFSGGQVPGGGTGSDRHNNGWAADIRIYEEQEGATGAPEISSNLIKVTRADVNTTNPADIEGLRIYAIAKSFFDAHITGMGADHDYQSGHLHVDISNTGNPRSSGDRSPYWGKAGPDSFTTRATPEFIKKAWVDAGNTPP
jgi:hypothetical protein